MLELKQLDPSILKRGEFENKRSYDNAVWFLEHLNDLVMLHNSGYVLFEYEKRLIPNLTARFFTEYDGKFDGENGEVDKVGQLNMIMIGAGSLIGHTRDLVKGRIYVSKKEANDFLKSISVVRKTDFHKFLDL